jgi:hypothetical protein
MKCTLKRVPSWRTQTTMSTAAAVVLLVGCADARSPVAPEDQGPTVPGLVVSESRTVPGTALASVAADESRVAYVSVSPGTLQGALSVRIRNVTTGALPLDAVPVIDGGFDPVIVSASPGDRIDFAVRQSGGTITHVTFVVPVRRPPVVVRTNPPKGRTDVALSIRPLVVFSEPIDAQSIGPATIRLLGNGMPVSGTIHITGENPLTAEFIPDAPLEAFADYEFVLTTGIRDVHGDALDDEVRVAFTTGAGASGLQVSNVTTGGAFDIDGYQVVVRMDARPLLTAPLELNTTLDLTSLPQGDLTVELSDVSDNCAVSGGSRRTVPIASTVVNPALTFDVTCTPPPELASIRLIFTIGNDSTSDLWTMNADGTGLRQLTAGPDWDWGPLVSPDGTRIAFSRMRADMPPGYEYVTFTYVMDPDGSNIRSVTGYGGAGAWLPDGATLAIDSYGLSSDVYLIGADGTNLRRLFRGDGFRQLAWSPDGSMIALRRYIEPLAGGCDDDPSGGWEIWIANADGTGARSLRRLATCDGYLGHLSWTADGRILFEDRALEEPSPLWSMRADGSNVVQVLAPNGMSFGAWSPDGTLVTLLGRDIFLMRVADGAVWRVTANGMSSTAAFLH